MSKAILALVLAPVAWTAEPIAGLWDAMVTVNNVEIPFRMEIAARGNKASGTFFNAPP